MKNRQLSLSDIQKDYISKEEFYQIAHICKETALWLIETGRVSAEKPKRKGFGYKIAKEEVERYLADRQQNPLYYLKGKRHNCIPYTPPQPYSSELGGAIRLAVEQEMSSLPDLLTEKQVCAILGYRGLHYPVHLLSCDETGARQLQIMAVPDYRVKLAKLMLRSAYRPPPEDAPAWDATYQNRPFVIGADMNLRRIDAAIASAKKRGCLPISPAALDAQGDAVLLRRYKDTGYAVIYKVTESVLTELFGRPPSLYLPPCTQYLTKKGAVVDAPLIQVDRKDRGSPRK